MWWGVEVPYNLIKSQLFSVPMSLDCDLHKCFLILSISPPLVKREAAGVWSLTNAPASGGVRSGSLSAFWVGLCMQSALAYFQMAIFLLPLLEPQGGGESSWFSLWKSGKVIGNKAHEDVTPLKTLAPRILSLSNQSTLSLSKFIQLSVVEYKGVFFFSLPINFFYSNNTEVNIQQAR